MHLLWFALRSLQIVGGALAVGFGPASFFLQSHYNLLGCKTKGDFVYV